MPYISTGFLQGTILGPLIFLAYIIDCVNISTHFNFILFADATTVNINIHLINKDHDTLFS